MLPARVPLWNLDDKSSATSMLAAFCLLTGFSVPPSFPGASGSLRAGAAVELWHQGALRVGNFRGRAEGSKSAFLVELSDGSSIKIDGGQLIDVWDDDGDDLLETGAVPSNPAEWASLRQQASVLLTELPPHMLDLRPLWQRLLNEKGAKKKRVSSSRVAADLFRSPHAEAGRNTRPVSAAGSSVAAATRLAQRLAAAQLLSEEKTLFKRIPIEVKPEQATDGAEAIGQGSSEGKTQRASGAGASSSFVWSSGGFKALPRATASSRAEMTLIEAMKARVAAAEAAKALGGGSEQQGDGRDGSSGGVDSKKAKPEEGESSRVWPTATLPLLAEVELLALGLAGVNKQLERVLSAFDQPPNATGARDLLLSVGQWNEGESDAESRTFAFSPNGAWLDPFPTEALQAGRETAERNDERRALLARTPSPPAAPSTVAGAGAGERGWKPWWLPAPGGAEQGGAVPRGELDPADVLEGRVDLRRRFPRAFAIDTDTTDFRDDAISYDLASATLAVHISDLTSIVPAGSQLDEVARLRLQTIYTGAMPLHMLPPSLLRECALSSRQPNECLTALLQLDAFGRVRHSRLVRSVIPPVRILSYDEVHRLISDKSIDSDVHRELQGLASITTRRAESRTKWGAGKPRADGRGGKAAGAGGAASPARRPVQSAALPARVKWRRSASDGSWRPEVVQQTSAHVLVDEVLAMFSYAARGTAKRHNLLRLPQMENHRIATAPLRRYADLISQRQLCAALCGLPGMPASEVAAVERWIRQKQSDLSNAKKPQPQMLRALEAHCARQATATGAEFAILEGTVCKPLTYSKPRGGRGEPTGRGGRGRGRGGGAGGRGGDGRAAHLEVRLAAGGVVARMPIRNAVQAKQAARLQPGQPLKVRLKSVDARRGLVDVELIDGPLGSWSLGD